MSTLESMSKSESMLRISCGDDGMEGIIVDLRCSRVRSDEEDKVSVDEG